MPPSDAKTLSGVGKTEGEMDGGVVVLWMFALAILLFWISGYVYGLFLAGKWLANRFRLKIRPLVAAVLIGTLALLLDLPVLPFQMEAVYKLTLLFGIWLVHVQPLVLGYWTGFVVGRERDEDRWKSTTESWVRDFEERPPEFMREFDDD